MAGCRITPVLFPGPNSVNIASTPVLGLEIESEHLKLILQAIRFGPKLSPWRWVNGSWVILAGISRAVFGWGGQRHKSTNRQAEQASPRNPTKKTRLT
jgi:hypothetical protein